MLMLMLIRHIDTLKMLPTYKEAIQDIDKMPADTLIR